VKKYLVLVFVSFIGVILQTSLFLEIFGPKVNPNIVFALGFAFLFSNKQKYALRTALVSGVLLDLLSFNVVGTTSLFMIFSFYASKFIQEKFFKGIGVLVFLSIIFFTIYKMLYGLGGATRVPLDAKILIGSTVSTAIALIGSGLIGMYLKDLKD